MRDVKTNTLKERLLSSANIFLAIYMVDSYVLNQELLNCKDRELLVSLKDVFDVSLIKHTIQEVQKRIQRILDYPNEYFETTVYFKPKGYADGKPVFRPLHTASLIDQIAMVAMLQILVYDPDEDKLIPSELSRLLPSNFYGNRISFDGRNLFKPWQKQYQEYSSRANNLLYEYSETHEYLFEVCLDLENFFPSVDPRKLYSLLLRYLPQRLSPDDQQTLKTIIVKLLVFRLDELNEAETAWYSMTDKRCIYAKGLPQGLPHTYFLSNIFMLLIKKAYKKIFPGEMLFYVDDSVIFTNRAELNKGGKAFLDLIEEVNKEIQDELKRLVTDASELSAFPANYYAPDTFKVKVHGERNNPKSYFYNIKEATELSGERYLREISRETSNAAHDLYTLFSDEEISMLHGRTEQILNAVEGELGELKDDQESYRKRLIRYRKFFKYRKTILDYRKGGDIKDLFETLIEDVEVESPVEIATFFEKYKDDILPSAIRFVLTRTEDKKDLRRLRMAVEKLIRTVYGSSKEHAYLYKAYEPFLKNEPKCLVEYPYCALKKAMEKNYRLAKSQTYAKKRNIYCDLLNINSEQLFARFGFEAIYESSLYVRSTSDELERRLLNAAYSYLFQYEINDSFVLAKKDCIAMQYSDVRVIAHLRNGTFDVAAFKAGYGDYTRDEANCDADYILLQVLELFKTFVRDPEKIDQLILIHKYCCDTWKNGSKYLHFYTLHNQEHAVTLIKLCVRWLHAVSYFELKQIDYFILFAACYLHDISMVTLPDAKDFYSKQSERADLIQTEFLNDFDDRDSVAMKRALYNAYQKIDAFFENGVRSKHASDSANEIRKYAELDFISPTERDAIARVSEAHGHETLDVYFSKSNGHKELVSEKMMKILLRLSDLLDISRYRISNVVLKHNLLNLNATSRFHWLSHLITDGCKLEVEYAYANHFGSRSCIERGNIVEKIVLNVDVLMAQTTTVDSDKKCADISGGTIKCGDDKSLAVVLKCNKGSSCRKECNFLCKWFVEKNAYLFEELTALKEYLNQVTDNYFQTDIEVRIRVVANTAIPNDVFDYLREYIDNEA